MYSIFIINQWSLKEKCWEYKLKISGNKEELINWILKKLSQETPSIPVTNNVEIPGPVSDECIIMLEYAHQYQLDNELVNVGGKDFFIPKIFYEYLIDKKIIQVFPCMFDWLLLTIRL